LCPKNARSGASLALALIAFGLGLSARLASAQEAADRTSLRPDLLVEQQWNSNIFSTEHDPEGSMVTIVRPSLTFLNEGELGYFTMNGWLSNHTYWEENELNGSDVGGSLRFDRKVTPRFGLFGNGSVSRFTDRDEIREDVGIAGQEVIVASGAPDVDYDDATLGLRWLHSARTRSELTGGPTRISYDQHPLGASTYRDRSAWFVNWELEHQLDPIDTLRFDLGASNTDQDGTTQALLPQEQGLGTGATLVPLETGESRSFQQSATLGWERVWSPVWTSNISVGVRRLDSHTSDASRFAATPIVTQTGGQFQFTPTRTAIPVDFDDVSPELIGTFLLQRVFPRSALTFQYQRTTQVNSGALSSDVNVDFFQLDYRYRATERITLGLVGNFTHYASANDAPAFSPAYFSPTPVADWDPATGASWTCGGLNGPGGKLIVTGQAPFNFGQCEIGTSSELTGQRWTFTAKLDWQMRKRLASYLVFRYYDQTTDPGLLGVDYNKYTVGIGFRYAYDLEL